MARQFAALRAPTVSKDKKKLETGGVETRWKVTYYDHAGNRHRKFFHSQAEAAAAAKIIQNRQLNEGINASTVAPGLREEAIACQKLVEGTGLSMRQVLELGLKHLPKSTHKTVSAILTAFQTNRETIRNLKKRTLDDHGYQLGRFARQFGSRLVDTISETEIENWLTQVHVTHNGKKRIEHKWGGKRRNVTLGYISALFNFGQIRKWSTTNPADGVDKAIVEKPPPEVWTPAQVELILNVAARDCPEILDFLNLVLFCGVRTCEAILLLSEHVKPEDGIVTVPAHISKTRKLRNVPIPANSLAWFENSAIREKTGRIWALSETSLHRRYRIIEAGTGFLWKDNALRCTFASNHIALYDNEYLTSRACGHSPKMLRDSYDAVVTKKHGHDHFNVFPPGAKPAEVLLAKAA